MTAQTSLVDSLRPAARDQVKLRDRILRATLTSPEQGAKGNSTVLQWDMASYAAFLITLAGDSSQVAVDCSNDLLAWFPADAQVLGTNNAPTSMVSFYEENNVTVGAIPTTNLAGNKQARFMRVRSVTPSATRNTGVTVALSQTPFVPLRPAKHLGPDNAWSYAAASGGIVNTTPVTLKAAVNTYHRNLCTQIELANGGTAGTEVILTDAAGPTILWRGYLAAGAVAAQSFDPPLRCAANSALTATLSSSTTVAVYVNARGLTALA